MEAVGNSCFMSVFIAPLENVLLKKKKNCSYNHVMVSKNSSRFNKIYCKLPESEIEENPRSQIITKSKNKMEEYNIAMKKMMRNPYEYHHDLGQSLFLPIWSSDSHFSNPDKIFDCSSFFLFFWFLNFIYNDLVTESENCFFFVPFDLILLECIWTYNGKF